MSQSKLYVGDLKEDVTKEDLEKVFSPYGEIRQVWVSHSPPGYAFVDFEDARDAEDASRALDKRMVLGSRIRVEFSRGGRQRDSSEDRLFSRQHLRRPFNPSDLCYECGQPGHYAYDCEIRIRRMRNTRGYYSPSPYQRRRRRSFSNRRDDLSHRRYRSRSRTPRRRYRTPSDESSLASSPRGHYDSRRSFERHRRSYSSSSRDRSSFSRRRSTSRTRSNTASSRERRDRIAFLSNRNGNKRSKSTSIPRASANDRHNVDTRRSTRSSSIGGDRRDHSGSVECKGKGGSGEDESSISRASSVNRHVRESESPHSASITRRSMSNFSSNERSGPPIDEELQRDMKNSFRNRNNRSISSNNDQRHSRSISSDDDQRQRKQKSSSKKRSSERHRQDKSRSRSKRKRSSDRKSLCRNSSPGSGDDSMDDEDRRRRQRRDSRDDSLKEEDDRNSDHQHLRSHRRRYNRRSRSMTSGSDLDERDDSDIVGKRRGSREVVDDGKRDNRSANDLDTSDQ
ncbi:hypothetical protein GJ496_011068 [Pomphorhynchus laevis]|nr:hypothetical protein GJ496_011068 [Pomphorhynchus laevis]